MLPVDVSEARLVEPRIPDESVASPTASCSLEVLARTDTVIVGEGWRRLEAALGQNSLLNSWLWTRPWLDHYGDLVPHRFLVARVSGETTGV